MLEQKTRGGRLHILWFPTGRSKLASEEGNSADWDPSVYTSTATRRGKQAGPAQ